MKGIASQVLFVRYPLAHPHFQYITRACSSVSLFSRLTVRIFPFECCHVHTYSLTRCEAVYSSSRATQFTIVELSKSEDLSVEEYLLDAERIVAVTFPGASRRRQLEQGKWEVTLLQQVSFQTFFTKTQPWGWFRRTSETLSCSFLKKEAAYLHRYLHNQYLDDTLRSNHHQNLLQC